MNTQQLWQGRRSTRAHLSRYVVTIQTHYSAHADTQCDQFTLGAPPGWHSGWKGAEFFSVKSTGLCSYRAEVAQVCIGLILSASACRGRSGLPSLAYRLRSGYIGA
jgi:hypothetical protein